jgi:hypothetical protein
MIFMNNICPWHGGSCSSHKIFGIGYPKTGSTSLAEALISMGYLVLHDQPPSLFQRMLNNDIAPLKNTEFDAFINVFPKAFFLYDVEFPNSKFILTTRDPETWFNSLKAWRIFHETPATEDSPLQPLLASSDDLDHYRRLESIENYGSIGINREAFIYKFTQHIEEVKQYFRERPGDLLVLPLESPNKSALLSDFLSKGWPDGTAYPHEKNRGNPYQG